MENANPALQRLFIAISLPDEIKNEIEKTQAELRRELPENFARWTKRQQFHLTLKFLGNVNAENLKNLAVALRGVGENFPSLRLRAEGIGFFPDWKFPRVIWVGARDESNLLPELQRAIEFAVRDFTSQKPEGKFAGHVTLGRIPRIKRSETERLANIVGKFRGRFFGEWTGREVELIRSELAPGGSRYATIETAAFSQKAK
ncbi:MAG TPA: RNA 2',3'-cyclic phosphodiesterase [Verrucomicrobiae bacterium]|jgi:2'-5' RNA ligase|nr:RNA 2',3'-cyclic phosphodiesterase [Verrucomicrobiae bacterium]